MTDIGTRDWKWLTDRVEVDDNGCWLWQLALTESGYGQTHLDVNISKYKHKTVTAHRLSLRLKLGYWPDFACHTCDVRACCNPEHLYDGTAKTNGKDAVIRNRSATGTNPRKARLGSVNGQFRVTEELRAMALHLYNDCLWTQQQVATELGVTQTTISKIVRA